MSGREKKEAKPDLREGNQGVCLKCRRVLPASAMGRDAAGCLTGYCDTCRAEVAANWGVDPGMVEWIRCMCNFEKFLQGEAEAVMAASVTMEKALPAELTALKNKIHHYHMIRHSRIPERLRAFLAEYREAWYTGVGVEAPDLTAIVGQLVDSHI